MQHPTLQIRDKLLTGLDRDYNVVDMAIVIDVLSQLENIPITKEALEVSRLGKHINELRRKSADTNLANRAKSLVKKWRQLLVVNANANSENSHAALVNGHGNATNGQNPSKPSSRLTSPMSEASKCNVGLSPALRHPGTGLSSLPSSASTSPGLPPSRPSTPMTGSKPVSPYLRSGIGMVNNKRQRCDDENGGLTVLKNGSRVTREPSSKRPRLNGNVTNHLIIEDSLQSEDSIIAHSNNHVLTFDDDSTTMSTTTMPATPKLVDNLETPDTRSSRRKNRVKEQVQDGLMQRMASIRKSAGKVRTTQELVQEMALRSASPALMNHRPTIVTTPNDLNEETKTELLNRFLTSQNEVASSPPLSDASPDPEPEVDQVVLDRPETVEDVLSRLPPIDTEAILAELNEAKEEDCEEDDELDVEGLIPPLPKPAPDTGPEVLNELHEGKKESFSGNFSHDGEFKEWFEVVSKRTKDDELIYILPYCVID